MEEKKKKRRTFRLQISASAGCYNTFSEYICNNAVDNCGNIVNIEIFNNIKHEKKKWF